MFIDLTPRRFLAALVVGAAILAAGCADTRGGTIPYDRPLAAPDAPTVQALESNYHISPLDKVSIKVFKGEEISGDYEVDLAGHISLPLVGEVDAVNMTTAELDDRLTQLLGAKYFEHPDVSVAIKESRAHVVTVDGAVGQAGQFQVAGPMTLIQAIALARGTRDDANPRRVAVFRTIGGQRQAAAFDLTAIRRGQARDPRIYAGDIVVVDGSRIKEVQRQIFSSIPLINLFRPF
ncbi:MAG TPA: polysaccharide biosynthesis/export family protein [Sphingomicrobium sp.]|nr:polysaccharide biosynthesis/export family protein [Sphingomicrobium sp.]